MKRTMSARLPLVIIGMALLSGCQKPAPPQLTPPSGLSASQRVEWSCKKCVRPIRRMPSLLDRVMKSNLPQPTEMVTIISADGTAISSYDSFLGNFKDVVSIDRSAPLREFARKLDKRIRESSYSLLAADGSSYTYRVAAVSKACDSLIVRPVDTIPPQPYLDIRRLAIPQLAGQYRLYEARKVQWMNDEPGTVWPDEDGRHQTITICGTHEYPMWAGQMLLFRPSDGSFIGFATPTSNVSGVVPNNIKPLMTFIEANTPIRLSWKPEPEAPLSALYKNMLDETPSSMQHIMGYVSYLPGVIIRSDGLALCKAYRLSGLSSVRNRKAVLNNKLVMMRYVRYEPVLDGDLWLPVKKLQVRAPETQKVASQRPKVNDPVYIVGYQYNENEAPYVTPARVSQITPFRCIPAERDTYRCWIFNTKGQAVGLVIGKGKPRPPVLVPIAELRRITATAK
ncbi:MAG: hypothetical protein ACYC1M_06495 [Armatimonadota bacterium]